MVLIYTANESDSIRNSIAMRYIAIDVISAGHECFRQSPNLALRKGLFRPAVRDRFDMRRGFRNENSGYKKICPPTDLVSPSIDSKALYLRETWRGILLSNNGCVSAAPTVRSVDCLRSPLQKTVGISRLIGRNALDAKVPSFIAEGVFSYGAL